MGAKLGIGSLASLLVVLLIQGCVFGGNDDGNFSTARSGAIPTATLPATLSEPVTLGRKCGDSGRQSNRPW